MTPADPLYSNIITGHWAPKPGADRVAIRMPDNMAPHLIQVLHGEYDVPGVEFVTPPTVLDIGANVGAYSIWAAHRWPGARVIAYEPHPDAFTLLKENCTFVEAHNVAVVASSVGPTHRPFAFGRDNAGESGLVIRDGVDTIRVDAIDVATLPDCDVWKADAEGKELELVGRYLKSRKGALPHVVCVEVHGRYEARYAINGLDAFDYTLTQGRICSQKLATLCFVRGN